MRAVDTVWLLLAAAGGPLASDSLRHTTCGYSAWTAPKPLPGISSSSLVQFGSVAIGREHGYLLGNDVPILGATPHPPGPLVLLRLDGQHIEPPPGRFTFAYPRGVIDPSGRLHLLWAEPVALDSLRDQTWRGGWERRLWHAAYARTTGWTTPQEVYRSDVPFFWSEASAATARLDNRGRIHVVARRAILDRSLVHVVIDGERHRHEVVPTPPGVYTDFVVDRDQLFVALMGWSDAHPEQKGDLYFTRVSTLGGQWTTPTLIRGSVEGHVREVQVVVTPDKAVHLVWAHSPRGLDYPEVLRHVQSSDSGRTWSPVVELAVPHPFSHLRAAVDECGAIQIVFAPWPSGDFSKRNYGYVEWAGRWGTPATLFPELHPLYLNLTTAPDGTLYLFAVARSRSRAETERPFPAIASRRPWRKNHPDIDTRR
jgi:hypothetical protein